VAMADLSNKRRPGSNAARSDEKRAKQGPGTTRTVVF
jgi:hypothetical protein